MPVNIELFDSTRPMRDVVPDEPVASFRLRVEAVTKW